MIMTEEEKPKENKGILEGEVPGAITAPVAETSKPVDKHSALEDGVSKKTESQIDAAMQKADNVIQNRLAQREKSLADTEARIDEKTKVLQALSKEAEKAGRSEVSQEKSEEDIQKERANRLLKGTGMEF